MLLPTVYSIQYYQHEGSVSCATQILSCWHAFAIDQKSGSLFDCGMKPVVYSVADASDFGIGWVRMGRLIRYYKVSMHEGKDLCACLRIALLRRIPLLGPTSDVTARERRGMNPLARCVEDVCMSTDFIRCRSRSISRIPETHT